MFTEPASLREIAAALVVSEAAVEQHLLRLYAKFEITPGGGSRRGRLANEAVRRRAVTLADLRTVEPMTRSVLPAGTRVGPTPSTRWSAAVAWGRSTARCATAETAGGSR